MQDFWDVAKAIGVRNKQKNDLALSRSTALELVFEIGDLICDSLSRGRLLRGILEDLAVSKRLTWYEITVLLAVLTSKIDTLLWLTLAQLTFELSEATKSADQ